MNSNKRYELRDGNYTAWSGELRPTQWQINRAAKSMDAIGWNGTALDLFYGLDWVDFAKPDWDAVREMD